MRAAVSAALCLATIVAVGAAHAPSPAPGQGQTPRGPDGRVRLGAPPGTTGYWGAPSTRTLVEAGAKVVIAENGLLANVADADRVAPFMPWSKAVFVYRQRMKLKDDPVHRCLPPGGPRQFQSEPGFQLLEQRELGRILVLLGGGNRNWRVIHTDGRPLGAPDEAVASYYGHSVGEWDGDTLVVHSVGYNERFWMGNSGLPHTEALHLIERFRRTNPGTLRYDVTVDDPRTYTRSWTAGWDLQWMAGQELPEYFCEGDKP